jgi:tRNA pseudouridine38-40 synthase
VPTPATVLAPVTGDLMAFEIEANAFCHQMVRSLVGTLVDVGRGRKRPSDMLWILRSADRRHASQPAPPQGLTLMKVRYPD